MKPKFLQLLGFGLILGFMPLAATAQSSAPDPAIAAIASSPAFQTFLNNLREAINSQDTDKLKACFHSKSLSIVAADKNATAKFAKRFSNPIPGECNVQIKPIAPNAPLPFADKGVAFPVRPSHQLQISFTSSDGQPIALVVFVILEKGKWVEVVPSTPQG